MVMIQNSGLMSSFSQEENNFYHETGVFLRERWSTLYFSDPPGFAVASSIPVLLERLMGQIKLDMFIIDEHVAGFRTAMGSRFLPRINDPTFYELEYDIPGVHVTYGDQITYPWLCCISYTHASTWYREIYTHRTVAQSWDFLVSVFQKQAPKTVSYLYTGVPDDVVTQAEQQLHMALPEDVKAWYTLANGRKEPDEYNRGLFDTWY
jgi:hypothetical protein